MTDVPLRRTDADWHCATEADTQAFAQRLAQHPLVGDALIALHGDLGAGKTTLVRYLLRALGVQGRIKSPTYAVVEPHHAPASEHWPAGLNIWHFDFYRFNDPREWEDAGFRELFAQPGLKLVEWPEKASGVLPLMDLEITLTTMDDDSRQLNLRANSVRGATLLEQLTS
ncbi:MAG: hypothetical protein RL758_1880 [Pseudomonadota bacterium]|jgi:tRNA threonylcarbamoyladenosine biosynthesis protein TsaE